MTDRPWEVGDQYARWRGYLDPTTGDPTDQTTWVLRNLVGARTWKQLRQLEDEFVEARALTLRAQGIPASYDLDGLQAIHRHLFQDVYAWAGQLRTVNMAKASPFAHLDEIVPRLDEWAQAVQETDNLRAVRAEKLPEALAFLYGGLNYAHPFREGNGRTQRDLLTALARESGHVLDWPLVQGELDDRVCVAAAEGEWEPMVTLFTGITTPHATPPLPSVVAAPIPADSPQHAIAGESVRARTRPTKPDSKPHKEERHRELERYRSGPGYNVGR